MGYMINRDVLSDVDDELGAIPVGAVVATLPVVGKGVEMVGKGVSMVAKGAKTIKEAVTKKKKEPSKPSSPFALLREKTEKTEKQLKEEIEPKKKFDVKTLIIPIGIGVLLAGGYMFFRKK